MKNILRVYIIYFDYNIINKVVSKLKKISEDNNIFFSGPVPQPKKMEKFDILRSPHVNKSSRDQLQIITYKKIIDFHDVTNTDFILLVRDCFFYYYLDFNFKFLI